MCVIKYRITEHTDGYWSNWKRLNTKPIYRQQKLNSNYRKINKWFT